MVIPHRYNNLNGHNQFVNGLICIVKITNELHIVPIRAIVVPVWQENQFLTTATTTQLGKGLSVS
jgi:hypothetical protein